MNAIHFGSASNAFSGTLSVPPMWGVGQSGGANSVLNAELAALESDLARYNPDMNAVQGNQGQPSCGQGSQGQSNIQQDLLQLIEALVQLIQGLEQGNQGQTPAPGGQGQPTGDQTPAQASQGQPTGDQTPAQASQGQPTGDQTPAQGSQGQQGVQQELLQLIQILVQLIEALEQGNQGQTAAQGSQSQPTGDQAPAQGSQSQPTGDQTSAQGSQGQQGIQQELLQLIQILVQLIESLEQGNQGQTPAQGSQSQPTGDQAPAQGSPGQPTGDQSPAQGSQDPSGVHQALQQVLQALQQLAQDLSSQGGQGQPAGDPGSAQGNQGQQGIQQELLQLIQVLVQLIEDLEQGNQGQNPGQGCQGQPPGGQNPSQGNEGQPAGGQTPGQESQDLSALAAATDALAAAAQTQAATTGSSKPTAPPPTVSNKVTQGLDKLLTKANDAQRSGHTATAKALDSVVNVALAQQQVSADERSVVSQKSALQKAGIITDKGTLKISSLSPTQQEAYTQYQAAQARLTADKATLQVHKAQMVLSLSQSQTRSATIAAMKEVNSTLKSLGAGTQLVKAPTTIPSVDNAKSQLQAANNAARQAYAKWDTSFANAQVAATAQTALSSSQGVLNDMSGELQPSQQQAVESARTAVTRALSAYEKDPGAHTAHALYSAEMQLEQQMLSLAKGEPRTAAANSAPSPGSPITPDAFAQVGAMAHGSTTTGSLINPWLRTSI